jgi:streptogramin lyase
VRAVIRAVVAWACLGLGIALVPAWSASADATDGTRLTAYGVQPATLGLTEVVTGTDGDLWGYLQYPGGAYLDDIYTNGVVKAVYSPGTSIDDIVAGGPGDVWYAATSGQFGPAVVEVAEDGGQTPFALPSGDGIPTAVAIGPDGNTWFASTGGFIGEFSAAGVLTQYSIPTQGDESVIHLAMGSDGALWFTEDLSTGPDEAGWVGTSTVGRITASGAVTLYPLASGTGDVGDLVLGADRNVWFTENTDAQGTSALVSVTPKGQITTHSLPAGVHGSALTAGEGGTLWVGENFDPAPGQVDHGQVAVVNYAGDQVAAYTEPGLSEVQWITTGWDGNIWYTDNARHAIIKINVSQGAAAAVTLSTEADPSAGAGHVAVVAHVTGSASSPQGPVTPTGTVVFSLTGSSLLVAPLVDGQATLDITGLLTAPGEQIITAQYYGDDYFLGAASAELHLLQPGTPITVASNSAATTDAFDTTGTGTGPQVLVALVSADGPGQAQSATVTGAGLTWTLAERANKEGGTAEIWTADAAGPLADATVTSSLKQPNYDELLTVLAFPNATGVGAGATAGEAGGVPAARLTTTEPGSTIVAVGEDYSQAIARTLPAGQLILSQWLDTYPGETFWTQQTPLPTAGALPAGAKVTVGTTAPTGDTWNFAAVEVVMGTG